MGFPCIWISGLSLPSPVAALGFASTALLWCCVAGCGDTSYEIPIWGDVSLRGAPITGGTLTFFPTRGRPVTTVISRDGEYSCRLPLGQYRVTITVGVDLPAGWKEGDPLPPPRLILPAGVASRKHTTLTATVADGQSGPIHFLLE